MRREEKFRVSESWTAALLAALLCFAPAALWAGKVAESLAEVQVGAGTVTFQPLIAHSQVRVTVTGPGGFERVETFGADGSAAIELPDADGLYKYELRFSPVLDEEARAAMAAARMAGDDLGIEGKAGERMVQRGTFSLAGGKLVPEVKEVDEKVVLTNANGVIRNALCVGLDCPDSPTFGDSSVLMMENNNRIKFGDTSVAPFPNNDWEIEANSNLSGGANYLGFNDCGTADNDGDCATDLVFAVEAGVRGSALYVESDGDIGIGTSNPVLDVHVVTGNSPGLRLDQDGSSGFAPQVWDIVGNETSFFIRDATHGSALPFRIRPGAPSNSIFVDVDGDVGMGTASPTADGLHILRSSAVATFRNLAILQANGPPGMFFSDTSANDHHWEFRMTSGGNFRISDTAANTTDDGVTEFDLTTAGDLTIAGGLVTTGGGGACTSIDPCDGVFSADFEIPSIQDHATFMWENSYLPAVGPTPVQGPINVTQKLGGMLNELEKAHIYIEQLNDRLEIQQKVIEELQARLAQLEAAK